jgi:hypothetical protein
MVSFEFEKPSTWSNGKRIAAVAVIFLLIGAFLSFSLFNPIVSIALIVFLLYLNFDIYLEKKDETRIKINHFILIIWGTWFLLSHLAIIIIWLPFDFFPRIFLIGVGLTAFGFFLCTLAGILEWRYPGTTRPGVSKVGLTERKREEPSTEVTSEPESKTIAQHKPQEGVPMTTVEEKPTKVVTLEPEQAATSAPSVTEKIDMQTREPTSEEEKNLLRWARHINEHGQTFEQCMKCNNYVFINAIDAGDHIKFECPDCGGKFELIK